MSTFIRTSKSTPCPICGRHGWCSYTKDRTYLLCRFPEDNQTSVKPIKVKRQRDGTQYSVFRLRCHQSQSMNTEEIEL